MEEKELDSDLKKSMPIKANNSAEIIVLSPLFLQNLGINLKNLNCSQECSVEENKIDDIIHGTKEIKLDSDKRTYKKIKPSEINNKQNETSTAETTKLMKNSVFMSPTFVSAANESLPEKISLQKQESDSGDVSTANKEIVNDGTINVEAIVCYDQIESVTSGSCFEDSSAVSEGKIVEVEHIQTLIDDNKTNICQRYSLQLCDAVNTQNNQLLLCENNISIGSVVADSISVLSKSNNVYNIAQENETIQYYDNVKILKTTEKAETSALKSNNLLVSNSTVQNIKSNCNNEINIQHLENVMVTGDSKMPRVVNAHDYTKMNLKDLETVIITGENKMQNVTKHNYIEDVKNLPILTFCDENDVNQFFAQKDNINIQILGSMINEENNLKSVNEICNKVDVEYFTTAITNKRNESEYINHVKQYNDFNKSPTNAVVTGDVNSPNINKYHFYGNNVTVQHLQDTINTDPKNMNKINDEDNVRTNLQNLKHVVFNEESGNGTEQTEGIINTGENKLVITKVTNSNNVEMNVHLEHISSIKDTHEKMNVKHSNAIYITEESIAQNVNNMNIVAADKINVQDLITVMFTQENVQHANKTNLDDKINLRNVGKGLINLQIDSPDVNNTCDDDNKINEDFKNVNIKETQLELFNDDDARNLEDLIITENVNSLSNNNKIIARTENIVNDEFKINVQGPENVIIVENKFHKNNDNMHFGKARLTTDNLEYFDKFKQNDKKTMDLHLESVFTKERDISYLQSTNKDEIKNDGNLSTLPTKKVNINDTFNIGNSNRQLESVIINLNASERHTSSKNQIIKNPTKYNLNGSNIVTNMYPLTKSDCTEKSKFPGMIEFIQGSRELEDKDSDILEYSSTYKSHQHNEIFGQKSCYSNKLGLQLPANSYDESCLPIHTEKMESVSVKPLPSSDQLNNMIPLPQIINLNENFRKDDMKYLKISDTVNKLRKVNEVPYGKLKDFEISENTIKNTNEHNGLRKITNKQETHNIFEDASKHNNQNPIYENKNVDSKMDLIASYLKKFTQTLSQNKNITIYKKHKKTKSKLSVQGVEKPGGSRQQVTKKQECNIELLPHNFTVKKTYNRKDIVKNKIKTSPHNNEVHIQAQEKEQSPFELITQSVPVDISLTYCICADYGHISYDESNYINLEHPHYDNKVISNISIEDLILDPCVESNFYHTKSFYEEILETSLPETASTENISICWQTIDDLISQSACSTVDNMVESEDNANKSSRPNLQNNHILYPKLESININMDTVMSNQKDFTNLSQEIYNVNNNESSLSFNRTETNTTAKDIEQSDIFITGTETTKNCNSFDPATISQAHKESDNQESSGSPKFIKSDNHLFDGEPQIESYLHISPEIKKRPAEDLIINNVQGSHKKVKLNIDEDSSQSSNNTVDFNDESTSSKSGFLYYPEFLPCDDCKQDVKTVEWINHMCLNNSYITEAKGKLVTLNGNNNVPRYLKKLLKKMKYLKCPMCDKKIKCAEVFLIHVNNCRKHDKLSEDKETDTMEVNNESDLYEEKEINDMDTIANEDRANDKFICGICKEVIDRDCWVTHIQTQHNYLAWRQGDTPLDFSSKDIVQEHLICLHKEIGLLVCNTCGLKQKRYRRSFPKYIEVYLEHVEHCGTQVLNSSITGKIQDITPNEDSNINEHTSDTKSINELNLSIDVENETANDNISICGVCKQTVKDTQWMKHIQIQHNYIAWKRGEKSLDVENVDELHKHLMNVCQETKYLICGKCGKRQNRYTRTNARYVDYYLKHIETCEVEAINTTLSQDKSLYHDKSEMETEREQSITCGVCQEVVESTCWIEHTQIKHNYLAWQKNTAPLDLNNSEQIEAFLVDLTKRIGSLACNNCGIKLKRYKRTHENYIKVYLKHLEDCARRSVSGAKAAISDSESVTCAVCSYEMKQTEWKKHLLYKHYNLSWRLNLDEPLDLHNNTVIERILKDYKKQHKMKCNNCGLYRASCFGFFAHVITCQKSEKEIEPYKFKCEICNSWALRVYYQPHMTAHKVQELNQERKNNILQSPPKEVIEPTTPFPIGKRKAAHRAMAVMEKYKNSTNDLKYKCNLCEFNTDCKQELKDHKCAEDGFSNDSDDSAQFSEQSSDESSEDIDINLSDAENNPTRKRKHSKETHSKIFTMPFTVKKPDQYIVNSCEEFKEQHYTEESLFTNWLSCEYEEVITEELRKYLPPLQESCKIKINNEWTTNQLFEARYYKGYNLFTGGCISCVSWAPSLPNSTQYLAVAVHNKSDTPRLNYDTLYDHPAILQIWSCHDLVGEKLPVFSLGIAHDFGTVWSMEWCPSGAQEPPSYGSATTSRMGLLAVACSNGFAYIFSVPHPPIVLNKFYKLTPVAELRLCMDSDRLKHQATAVSWSKHKGHSLIVVGYADGTIAMFDLNCDSPLLKRVEKNTTIFYPYFDEQSVSGSITGLSIYPNMDISKPDADIAALGCGSTTGAQMRVPGQVVSSRYPVNDALFMPQWPALYYTIDDNTGTNPLTELEVWGGGRRGGGGRTAAACYCCPRLFVWAPPLLRTIRAHPVYTDIKRYTIAVLEMEPLKGVKKWKNKTEDDLALKVEPTTYEGAIAKYGIKLQLTNNHNGHNPDTDLITRRPDLYPLAEVNSLAPCPAPHLHNWLAVGSHAGFVFIIPT